MLSAQGELRNIGIVLCVVATVFLAVNLAITIPAYSASTYIQTKTSSETSPQTGFPATYPEPVDVAVGPYWYSKSVVFTSIVPNVETVGFRINSDNQVTLTLRYSGQSTAPAVTVIVSTGGYPMPYPPYVYGAETKPVPSPYVYEPEGNRTLTPAEGGMETPPAEGGTETRPIPPEWYPYPMLIGSNVISKGWSSPEDMTLNLVGEGSVYDATSITVTIIPFTG